MGGVPIVPADAPMSTKLAPGAVKNLFSPPAVVPR